MCLYNFVRELCKFWILSVLKNLNVNRVGAARSRVESDIKSKSKPEVQRFQLQKKRKKNWNLREGEGKFHR